MSKDYKNRIPAYRQARRHSPSRWGIVGAAVAVIALCVGLGIYFFTGPEGENEPPMGPGSETADAVSPAGLEQETAQAAVSARKSTSNKDKGRSSAKIDSAPGTPPQPEPRFSFYKILAEKEVVIPENEIKTMKREESEGKKPETAYLLQAGSFTSQQDAEKLRARLAEIKVKARLEKITLENATWYRVKIGPYATVGDADKVRQYLRGNKIDSIVQKAAPR